MAVKKAAQKTTKAPVARKMVKEKGEVVSSTKLAVSKKGRVLTAAGWKRAKLRERASK